MRSHRKELVLTFLALAWLTGVASAECTANLRYLTEWWFSIPTTGDEVYCEGYMHMVVTYTVDQGGGYHGHFQVQPQGLGGEVVWGPNCGARYRGTGITQETFNLHKGETYTFINNYRLIGAGKAPNLCVHETWHFTFNANGELTAYVDNVRVTCD